LFDLEAFRIQLYTLQDDIGFCSTTSGEFRSTGEVVSERLRAHRFVFSLSGSIWEHLEGSVWLFRVTELFGYDFQTILHFAAVWEMLYLISNTVETFAVIYSSEDV